MPTAYISFSAEINQSTSEILLGSIFDHVNKGTEALYLLFSSSGGGVDQGITIYNLLRGLPVPLTIHNVGSVNSIANVIFLAGKKRIACQHSTFMFHGVGFNVKGEMRIEEKFLRDKAGGLIGGPAKNLWHHSGTNRDYGG